MSFSERMKRELISLPIKMNCCRKAYLFGLLYNASHKEGIAMTATFGMREAAQRAVELLGETSHPFVRERSHAGRRLFELSFSSKAFAGFELKVSDGESIASAAKFRCADCGNYFLAGVLASCTTVSDPQKGYHMEISLDPDKGKRLEALDDMLVENGFAAGRAERARKISLYFKNNNSIADVLSFAGAVQTSFDVTNAYIEKDIRNRENRATNCVAKNISKSVDAVRRQLAAIELLTENHKLDTLPQELRETARLRIENDDVSLSELALLHEPPISKSGLNHRLEKICRAAEELEKE